MIKVGSGATIKLMLRCIPTKTRRALICLYWFSVVSSFGLAFILWIMYVQYSFVIDDGELAKDKLVQLQVQDVWLPDTYADWCQKSIIGDWENGEKFEFEGQMITSDEYVYIGRSRDSERMFGDRTVLFDILLNCRAYYLAALICLGFGLLLMFGGLLWLK